MTDNQIEQLAMIFNKVHFIMTAAEDKELNEFMTAEVMNKLQHDIVDLMTTEEYEIFSEVVEEQMNSDIFDEFSSIVRI